MFASWIDDGAPVAAWLPGFFFTQSFLTAVLQNFARKYKLPVDSLKFSYNILPDPPSAKPDDGCCIDGLYLDGGRWNSNHQCIADPQPKVIIFTHLTHRLCFMSTRVFVPFPSDYHHRCYLSHCLLRSCCQCAKTAAVHPTAAALEAAVSF